VAGGLASVVGLMRVVHHERICAIQLVLIENGEAKSMRAEAMVVAVMSVADEADDATAPRFEAGSLAAEGAVRLEGALGTAIFGARGAGEAGVGDAAATRLGAAAMPARSRICTRSDAPASVSESIGFSETVGSKLAPHVCTVGSDATGASTIDAPVARNATPHATSARSGFR